MASYDFDDVGDTSYLPQQLPEQSVGAKAYAQFPNAPTHEIMLNKEKIRTEFNKLVKRIFSQEGLKQKIYDRLRDAMSEFLVKNTSEKRKRQHRIYTIEDGVHFLKMNVNGIQQMIILDDIKNIEKSLSDIDVFKSQGGKKTKKRRGKKRKKSRRN